jgi:hypothetical protein
MLSGVPQGALIDSPRYAPQHHTAEALYSDQTWRPCNIIAWARHREGWAALIRWPSGREDWRHFDRRSLRPRCGDPAH